MHEDEVKELYSMLVEGKTVQQMFYKIFTELAKVIVRINDLSEEKK